MSVLDLFCGAGGLAQGFSRAGFKVTGVDLSDMAGETFRINQIGKFQKADLSRELVAGNYDIITGGPPCKPWSSVNVTKRGSDHPDYNLVKAFFSHVEHHLPSMFLLENVPPLSNDPTIDAPTRNLGKLGYSIQRQVVRYSDYGAATQRHRLIIFGIMNGHANAFFQRLSQMARPSITVKQAIWRLRDVQRGGLPDHEWPKLRTIERYRDYYKTGKFGWYILNWNEPAPSFGNIMKTYILHPDAFNGGITRVISVREALSIMGFDEDFQFPTRMGLGIRYQMVADAVSPVFSRVCGSVVREMLAAS